MFTGGGRLAARVGRNGGVEEGGGRNRGEGEGEREGAGGR